jgi:hypothetical protein
MKIKNLFSCCFQGNNGRNNAPLPVLQITPHSNSITEQQQQQQQGVATGNIIASQQFPHQDIQNSVGGIGTTFQPESLNPFESELVDNLMQGIRGLVARNQSSTNE